MRQPIINKEYKYTCDSCGKTETLSATLKTAWIQVTEVQNNGIRVFEKTSEIKPYETFNIPNKVEKTYCTKVCALKSIVSSIELFLAEIAPIRSGSSKPLQ